MKTTNRLFLAGGATLPLLGTAIEASEGGTLRPPNVIMILADDLGWSDTTLYGTTDLYETPNIERLAERGVTFTRAYAASPLCSPTRASILTGQNPARTGLTIPSAHQPGFVRLEATPAPTGPAGDKVTPLHGVNRLDTKYPTLGKVLQEAGYATGHFGKWHLGHPPFSPLEHGFEVDLPAWPGPGPGHSYIAPWSFSGYFKEDYPGQHIEDRMAKEAVNWMRNVRDERPFYAQYWQFSVHGPWEAKPELVDYYRGKIDLSTPQNSPTYAAMVHTLDDAVGALLDEVDRSGQADHTVIIFFSDNGGNVHIPVDGTIPTYNAPLRAGKASVFEGGIRVPAIVVWPGVIEPGSRSDAIIQTTDLYPTILSILGINTPENHPLDGEDFTPLLHGEDWQRTRPIMTYLPHYASFHDWLPPSIAIHEGDWKLIRLFHHGDDGEHDYMLFNLREDIGETTNLADSHPERVRSLDRLVEDYIQEASVVVPVRNPKFDPDQYRPELIGVQRIRGLSRPAVIPERVVGPSLSTHVGWSTRYAQFEPTDDGTLIHQQGLSPVIVKTGFEVKTPAVLEMQLEVPENGQGRVEWRKSHERDFADDSVVIFRVRPSEHRVSIPLPDPDGQSILQLRIFLPPANSAIKIHEIILRGKDGTVHVDHF